MSKPTVIRTARQLAEHALAEAAARAGMSPERMRELLTAPRKPGRPPKAPDERRGCEIRAQATAAEVAAAKARAAEAGMVYADFVRGSVLGTLPGSTSSDPGQTRAAK